MTDYAERVDRTLGDFRRARREAAGRGGYHLPEATFQYARGKKQQYRPGPVSYTHLHCGPWPRAFS